MESLQNKNNPRIFLEILRELARHSPAYLQMRKTGFSESSPMQIKIPEKKIIAEAPRLNVPLIRNVKSAQTSPLAFQQVSERKKVGGINEAVNELKTEKYQVSLKPIAQQREINRPALGSAKLIIPEQKLPPHFQYLQPTPTNKEMDLGKLNPLIKDPMVKIIDCPGPDQNVAVTGSMGTKKTGIMLGRDEITEIVEKFSKESKIPVSEGIFRVVVGRFVFLAIVSEIIGSRFTLRKMIAAPGMPQR
ncbi:MAG: hypothetical protein AABX93_01735 [Nanoarchaeota archaeon]